MYMVYEIELDAFVLTSNLTLGQFTFVFKDIGKTFKICTDEMFDLTNFITFLDKDKTIKFCMRFTGLETYMPKNGQLYIKVIPHFSATIRHKSAKSMMGFSGGIEYKGKTFYGHVSLTDASDWQKPSQTRVVRQDLKWFKPIEIQSKNKYEKPIDLTHYALIVAVLYYIYQFFQLIKEYRTLRHAEIVQQQEKNELKRQEEEMKKEHEEWIENLEGDNKQFQKDLQENNAQKQEKEEKKELEEKKEKTEKKKEEKMPQQQGWMHNLHDDEDDFLKDLEDYQQGQADT